MQCHTLTKRDSDSTKMEVLITRAVHLKNMKTTSEDYQFVAPLYHRQNVDRSHLSPTCHQYTVFTLVSKDTVTYTTLMYRLRFTKQKDAESSRGLSVTGSLISH